MEGTGMTPELETLKARLRATWYWTENNRATDGTTVGDAEYLEVIAVRG